MEPALRQRFRELLLSLREWETSGDRRLLLRGPLEHQPLWDFLNLEGASGVVADRLLDLCEKGGAGAIEALLAGLRQAFPSHPARLEEIQFLESRLCRGAAQRRREAWRGAPFRGLSFFDRQHAPIFFGREAEVQELIETIATEQGRRFCVLLGASGAGKSSLVRAGLWPALSEGLAPAIPGSEHWLISAMTPTERGAPLDSLREAAFRAIERHEDLQDQLDSDWRKTVGRLGDGVSLAQLAAGLLERIPSGRWLLLLDQMEELFTAVSTEEAAAFLDLLTEAVKPPEPGQDPPLQILATLRADFYHRCLEHPALKRLMNRSGGSYSLGPPGRLALERMVSGPINEVDLQEKQAGDWARAAWFLDPALPARISVDAAGQPGGLALMAFTLRELYDRGKSSRRMDLATYEDPSFGGLSGAIGRRAEAVLQDLGEGADAALESVFAHLVRVQPDEAPTRRRERRSTWNGDAEAGRLVDAFVEARLLVAHAEAGREPTVEVAHEALLREWPKLARWIEERREALGLAERVRTEARAWEDSDAWRNHRRPWSAEVIEDIRKRLAAKRLLEQLEGEGKAVKRLLTPEVDWIQQELLLETTGHQRRRDIGQRLAEIGDPRPGVGVKDGVPQILWRPIPPGTVEVEEHGRFQVEPFHIAAYPITIEQFAAFLKAKDGFNNKAWWKELKRLEPDHAWRSRLTNHPVTEVSWHDATAFCRWLSRRLGFEVRLPDEPEWQWAAQSAEAEFAYPWGPGWKDGVANTSEAGINRTTAVGVYPSGASRQGAFDLAGNVWEWCRNEHEDPKKVQPSEGPRALRGGSWVNGQGSARASYRSDDDPYYRNYGIGFRVVCSSPIR